MRTLPSHPATPPSADLKVEAEIVRQGEGVALVYLLSGRIDRLLIPTPTASERADGLWRTTCFEAFLGAERSDAYLELNLSPSGRWAAYRFESRRQGMRPADLGSSPRVETFKDASHFELKAIVGLGGFPPVGALWLVGLTAVIEEADGSKSYFALAHPSGKPDFHDSRGFVLEVPA